MKPLRITVITNLEVLTIVVDRYVHESDSSYLVNPRPATPTSRWKTAPTDRCSA